MPAARPFLAVVPWPDADEAVEFLVDGDARVVGSDPSRSDLVVGDLTRPSAPVLAQIWRMDDELWIRNLNRSLEIRLVAGDQVAVLPPAAGHPADPGPARSIPAGYTRVWVGSSFLLTVVQVPARDAPSPPDLRATDHLSVPGVPPSYRRLAAALCEPLLTGGRLPAGPTQVALRAGLRQPSVVHRLLTELTDLYLGALPTLAHLLRRRLRRDRRRHGPGVTRWFEVAHLLVRRELVSLDALSPSAERTGRPARAFRPIAAQADATRPKEIS